MDTTLRRVALLAIAVTATGACGTGTGAPSASAASTPSASVTSPPDPTAEPTARHPPAIASPSARPNATPHGAAPARRPGADRRSVAGHPRRDGQLHVGGRPRHVPGLVRPHPRIQARPTQPGSTRLA